MMATWTSTANTTDTVSEQTKALSHMWDDYLYPPEVVKLWSDLARKDRIAERLLRIGKIILINVLPAAIPLQVLVYFDAVNWVSLALDVLLVLEIGPCRILTRLVDKVAPYPQESLPREDREDIPYTGVTPVRTRDGLYAKSLPILPVSLPQSP